MRASDVLRPLVRELYRSASVLVERKADSSAFTIADGLVQELLTRHLFRSGFAAVVGEEDASNTELTRRPYHVSSLPVPAELHDGIDAARAAINLLSAELGAASYGDCTVFIDPIDGTKEFSSGLGEQCTILVGFAVGGRPCAGLVYRPLSEPLSWAAGCGAERYFEAALDDKHAQRTTSTAPNAAGLLTTNGAISGFLEALLSGLAQRGAPGSASAGAASLASSAPAAASTTTATPEARGPGPAAPGRVMAGGVGNKVLSMIEGRGACYISDRGVSRWDTCAAQAVLEARGGLLAKLAPALRDGTLESYTYRRSSVNLDFDGRDPVALTPHNAAGEAAKGALASGAQDLKPYANVCGLLALDRGAAEDLPAYLDLLRKAAREASPVFD